MRISAGADPLALSNQKQASDDRSLCLENPRPEGAESSLTENVTSPFQAEPAHPSLTLAGENRAYMIYTSGSSGNPKGVEGTHRASMNRFAWMWKTYPFVE